MVIVLILTPVLIDQVANLMTNDILYLGKPMICMGDMNDILYHIGKCNVNVNYYHMSPFCALIKNRGFFDIGYGGPAYTWRNSKMQTLMSCLGLESDGLVPPQKTQS